MLEPLQTRLFSSLFSVCVSKWASLWPSVCFHSSPALNSASCSPSPSVFPPANSSTLYGAAEPSVCGTRNMFNDTWPEPDQKLERHSCKLVGGSEGGKTQIPTNIKHTGRERGGVYRNVFNSARLGQTSVSEITPSHLKTFISWPLMYTIFSKRMSLNVLFRQSKIQKYLL